MSTEYWWGLERRTGSIGEGQECRGGILANMQRGPIKVKARRMIPTHMGRHISNIRYSRQRRRFCVKNGGVKKIVYVRLHLKNTNLLSRKDNSGD